MKKSLLVLLVLIASASAGFGGERFALGDGGVAVKVERMTFTDFPDTLVFKGSNFRETYTGIEVFGRIAPNLYLGAEVGYGEPSHSVYDDLLGPVKMTVTYVPVEFSIKYGVALGKRSALSVGAGLSASYAKEEVRAPSITPTRTDWVAGAQASLDLNVILGRVMVGVNGKYQATEDFLSGGYGYSNLRTGAHVGLLF